MSRSSVRSSRLQVAAGVAFAGAACLLVLAAALVVPHTQVLASSDPVTVHNPDVLDHPDRVCRQCHQQIYDAYQKTSMARGSGPAEDGLDHKELEAQGLMHDPSGIRYIVSQAGGKVSLAFDRPRDSVHDALHGVEDLRYFIGSGHRGRTFLYQQDGLWFETPINWYGKKGIWDMAPAYSDTLTMPPPLPTDANCLHCHAGGVQPSVEDVRNRFAGSPFHSGGVGCAACHGDPAAHLAAVAQYRAGSSHTRSGASQQMPGNIINPDKLTPVRRDSICLQCHLEGDATVYRPGNSLATFVPGQELSSSAVYFVDRTRAQEGGRASSQYEALLRSACMRAVGDRLTCTTCHDPHSSPEPQERVAFFRAKCLTCHNSPAIATQHHPDQPDCATCHMPTRKTLDISHEQLTDHNIEALPETGTVLLTRSHVPDLVPVGATKVTIREEGLAYAQLAQRGDRASGERALHLLEAASRGGADDPEVHDELGFLLQRANQPAEAAAQYRATLREQPLDTTAAANLAVLEAGQGNTTQAIDLLKGVIQRDPSRTTAGLNLAFLECRMGQQKDALAVVELMLRFSPDSTDAHRFLDKGEYGGQQCTLR
jgi:predicted CXXCH cytochrome family protein